MTHPLDSIARVCHEVNRAYCQALGDDTQPTWEGAPEWQRASARMGVDLHLAGDFGPEASHLSWMQQKLDEGWRWGPTKNPDAKEHPCMVPFAELPREQQAKDFIFRAVVHALRPQPSTDSSIETSEREASAPASKPVTDAELPNRGPRVTPADVEAEIASEEYFTAAQGVLGARVIAKSVDNRIDNEAFNYPNDTPLVLLTFCVLTLRNGFTVTGESACASPENFDAAIGKRIARQAAVAKVWPLLGFRLRDKFTDDAISELMP